MGGAWASDLSTWSLVAPKRRNPPGEGTPGPVSAARRASSDLSAGATLSGQHGLALTCRPQWALLWAHHATPSYMPAGDGKVSRTSGNTLRKGLFLLLFFRQFRSDARVPVIAPLCLTPALSLRPLQGRGGRVPGHLLTLLCACPALAAPSSLGPRPVLS